MLTFEAPLFRVKLRGRVTFQGKQPPPPHLKPSEAARALALGHRIVRAVSSGEVRSFTEAGRRMGLHQARVSVLVAMSFLAPDLQEGILLGRLRLKGRVSQLLVAVAREPRWEAQRKLLAARTGQDPLELSPTAQLDPEG